KNLRSRAGRIDRRHPEPVRGAIGEVLEGCAHPRRVNRLRRLSVRVVTDERDQVFGDRRATIVDRRLPPHCRLAVTGRCGYIVHRIWNGTGRGLHGLSGRRLTAGTERGYRVLVDGAVGEAGVVEGELLRVS